MDAHVTGFERKPEPKEVAEEGGAPDVPGAPDAKDAGQYPGSSAGQDPQGPTSPSVASSVRPPGSARRSTRRWLLGVVVGYAVYLAVAIGGHVYTRAGIMAPVIGLVVGAVVARRLAGRQSWRRWALTVILWSPWIWFPRL
jgi:hypothetical protein